MFRNFGTYMSIYTASYLRKMNSSLDRTCSRQMAKKTTSKILANEIKWIDNVDGSLITLLSRKCPVHIYQLNFIATSEAIHHVLKIVTTCSLQQISLPPSSKVIWNGKDMCKLHIYEAFIQYFYLLMSNTKSYSSSFLSESLSLYRLRHRRFIFQHGWTHFISPKHRSLAPWNMNSTVPNTPSY